MTQYLNHMRKQMLDYSCKGAVKRAITLPVRVMIVLVAAIAILLRPFYRPIVTAISSLRSFVGFEAWINTLPRLGILTLLAVPFIIAEPMKFGALFIMAKGHIVLGVVLEFVSHFITFVLVERIYNTGREKLLTYGWLAWMMGYVSMAHAFFEKIKDQTLTRLRSMRSWKVD